MTLKEWGHYPKAIFERVMETLGMSFLRVPFLGWFPGNFKESLHFGSTQLRAICCLQRGSERHQES